MVEITETFFAKSKREWRGWLSSNHGVRREIWLVLLKKHVDEPCISYEEAVRESLCYGWIDGIMKRIDDRSHVIRFSPRRRDSVWSRSNLQRVEELIKEGRMMEPGLSIYDKRDPEKCDPIMDMITGTLEIPDYLMTEIQKDQELEIRFNSLAPSMKKQYLYWITSAKREETRIRRMKKAIGMILKGEKPGMN